jgi:hypothetical protein
MIYVMINQQLDAIECYSSFRITDINKENLNYVPGEFHKIDDD